MADIWQSIGGFTHESHHFRWRRRVASFPLSRKSYPKQFLKLEDERSLLVHTVERFLDFVAPEDVLVVTNERYLYHVQSELAECHAEGAHGILEPVTRNTAPAIALALRFCEERLGCDGAEPLVVAAADHVIRPQDVFTSCIAQAAAVAQEGAGCLVTFGIPARSPETGYGYIEAGDSDGRSFAVESFQEKPDLETAERYVTAGNYYWNSGMFAFTLDFMKGELARYQPEIAAILEDGYDAAVAHFAAMPEISIDYAVAERSQAVRMVPLTCYWNDIGSWDAVYDILPHDADGNAVQGDVLALDCRDSLIMGHDRLIAGIGLDDL